MMRYDDSHTEKVRLMFGEEAAQAAHHEKYGHIPLLTYILMLCMCFGSVVMVVVVGAELLRLVALAANNITEFLVAFYA